MRAPRVSSKPEGRYLRLCRAVLWLGTPFRSAGDPVTHAADRGTSDRFDDDQGTCNQVAGLGET